MKVLVIDAQGGGLGKQLISRIKKEIPELTILAVGTNTTATAVMLKAGADEVATGVNAVVVASRKADIIVGPIGMLIADSMLGEITPQMSVAIAQAEAKRVIIPFSNCENYVAGVGDFGISHLIDDALQYLRKIVTNT